MKKIFYLLLALSITAASCRTKDGEPGPAGESSLSKQGSISATVTYTDGNGNAASTTSNYQYYETVQQNKFIYEDYSQSTSYYEVDVRRRDISEPNNYFDITLRGYASAGVEEDPYSTDISFTYITVINNQIASFYSDGLDVTNVVLDPATGRVTFDFSGTGSDIDGNEVTISGKADLTLNRLRQNILL